MTFDTQTHGVVEHQLCAASPHGGAALASGRSPFSRLDQRARRADEMWRIHVSDDDVCATFAFSGPGFAGS